MARFKHEPRRQVERQRGAGRKPGHPSGESRQGEAERLTRSTQIALAAIGLVLRVIENQLQEVAGYFTDSPLREAMAEAEIPSDVPTALHEAVESFQETVRSLRASVDEAANYTNEHLARHWQEQRNLMSRNETGQ